MQSDTNQLPPKKLKGRPQKEIDLTLAVELIKSNSRTKVAQSLGVNRNTLYRHLQEPEHYLELSGVSKTIAEYYDKRLQEREERRQERKLRKERPSVIGRPRADVDIQKAADLISTLTIQESAKQLGISRNTLGRILKDAGLGRNVPGWRPGIAQPKRIRVERIELSYPYLLSTETDGADLVVSVNSVVSYNLPSTTRADICQELLLAILSGEIALSDLRKVAVSFIKAYFRKFPTRYGAMSLDAPAPPPLRCEAISCALFQPATYLPILADRPSY